jgi:hypothetical protein
MLNMTTPKTKPNRKRISEALLADRLGLNEPWIERWEEGGRLREESSLPDRLPDFITKIHKKKEIEGIESDIKRLVTAGCQRRVVYFCLAQLSPEADRLRAGGERQPVFGRGDVAENEDYWVPKPNRLATHQDLQSVANTAKSARKQIHRYQHELTLIAETTECPLPVGLMCRPESPVDALTLLQDSLSWAAKLAVAYTAPFATTLLKSKGVLYLTLYVSKFVDSKKLRGSKLSGVFRDSGKPSGSARSGRTSPVDGHLKSLANAVTRKKWSASELHEKLNDFREDHPRLFERLAEKLAELHDFASR